MVGMEVRRGTAVKVSISEISSGRFVRQEGMKPNYVMTPEGRKISRAWVTGVVVSTFRSDDGNYSSITIDDSTGVIRAKAFGGLRVLDGIETGDIVDVIGKIREYNGEMHIIPEAVRKIGIEAEMLRELEKRLLLEKWRKKAGIVKDLMGKVSDMDELKRVAFERFGITEDEVDGIVGSSKESAEPEPDDRQMVLDLIGKLDQGDGAPYSELLEQSGLPEARFDEIMTELLEEGLCYEPRPGKIKRL